MPRLLLLLTAALAVSPLARAQPSADELLATWREAAQRSAEDVVGVRLREILERSIDGPRGEFRILTVGDTQLSPLLRPRRFVDELWINDEEKEVSELQELERRLQHALGPAAGDLRRPPALAVRTMAHAVAEGAVDRVQLDGTAAWRISGTRPFPRGPRERLTVWFTASRTSPQLLRMKRVRSLPDGGLLSRRTTYRRVDGLDVPLLHTVDAQIEQRRRLRTYTLVLRAEATYGAPEIERE